MKLFFGIILISAALAVLGHGLGIYSAFKVFKSKALLGIILLAVFGAMGGYAAGLFAAYKAHKQEYKIGKLRVNLDQKQKIVNAINKKMPKRLLFIHHSVGNDWLGSGGLGAALLENGIGVHNATYGDEIGQDTDLNHWASKFQNDINKIFSYNYYPNVYYEEGDENDIIMFKSCFPNSNIVGLGEAPGNPMDPIRTIWNNKSVLNKLKDEFAKYPQKIFIYVTAPPLVPNETAPENAKRAREFNDWAKNEFSKKYIEETGLDNFLIFDFFDILADGDNYLKAEFRFNENDSHPNPAGGRAATKAFIEFLKNNGLVAEARD